MPSVNYLMLYDQNLAQIGGISARVARQYCERHGYRFTCHTELLDPNLHPSWNKVVALRRHLAESDWTFWCDADTIICDPSFTMDRLMALVPDRSLAMSHDPGGLNNGVFLLRNCAWSAQYLDTLLFLGRRDPPARPKSLHEQETIHLIARRFPAVRKQIAIIAETVIANPRSPACTLAPFIMHYWSSWQGQDKVAAAMTEVQAKGWGPRGWLK
jgi:hypothetical protein